MLYVCLCACVSEYVVVRAVFCSDGMTGIDPHVVVRPEATIDVLVAHTQWTASDLVSVVRRGDRCVRRRGR